MQLGKQLQISINSRALSIFSARKAEYNEAKIKYDAAYATLEAEAKRVLKLYAPLKTAVSDRNWNNKRIANLKVANDSKTIELTLEYNIQNSVVSYWKFPSWMIGAETDLVVEGLKQIIEEDGQRFAKKEQERLERVRAKELAQLEELKQKYSEVSDGVS